jgi:hypothetical protein
MYTIVLSFKNGDIYSKLVKLVSVGVNMTSNFLFTRWTNLLSENCNILSLVNMCKLR